MEVVSSFFFFIIPFKHWACVLSNLWQHYNIIVWHVLQSKAGHYRVTHKHWLTDFWGVTYFPVNPPLLCAPRCCAFLEPKKFGSVWESIPIPSFRTIGRLLSLSWFSLFWTLIFPFNLDFYFDPMQGDAHWFVYFQLITLHALVFSWHLSAAPMLYIIYTDEP